MCPPFRFEYSSKDEEWWSMISKEYIDNSEIVLLVISMNVLLVSFVLRVLTQDVPLVVTHDYSNQVES